MAAFGNVTYFTSCTDGKDDDGDGDRVRSVLAAAALRQRCRRPPADDLELRTHSAGVDRLSLVGGQQLLLESDRVLLDQRHSTFGVCLRRWNVVSLRASNYCIAVTRFENETEYEQKS